MHFRLDQFIAGVEMSSLAQKGMDCLGVEVWPGLLTVLSVTGPYELGLSMESTLHPTA